MNDALVHKTTMAQHECEAAIVSNDDDDHDDTPTLMSRGHNSYSDSDDDTDNEMPALMSRSFNSDSDGDDDTDVGNNDEKLVPLKKVVVNTSIDEPSSMYENVLNKKQTTSRSNIDPRMPEMSINDAYHEWGRHSEERLRGIVRAKNMRLVTKSPPCDACGVTKAKEAPIPRTLKVKRQTMLEREFLLMCLVHSFKEKLNGTNPCATNYFGMGFKINALEK